MFVLLFLNNVCLLFFIIVLGWCFTLVVVILLIICMIILNKTPLDCNVVGFLFFSMSFLVGVFVWVFFVFFCSFPYLCLFVLGGFVLCFFVFLFIYSFVCVWVLFVCCCCGEGWGLLGVCFC